MNLTRQPPINGSKRITIFKPATGAIYQGDGISFFKIKRTRIIRMTRGITLVNEATGTKIVIPFFTRNKKNTTVMIINKPSGTIIKRKRGLLNSKSVRRLNITLLGITTSNATSRRAITNGNRQIVIRRMNSTTVNITKNNTSFRTTVTGFSNITLIRWVVNPTRRITVTPKCTGIEAHYLLRRPNPNSIINITINVRNMRRH